jgi:hypothetical protein
MTSLGFCPTASQYRECIDSNSDEDEDQKFNVPRVGQKHCESFYTNYDFLPLQIYICSLYLRIAVLKTMTFRRLLVMKSKQTKTEPLKSGKKPAKSGWLSLPN